MEFSWSEIVGIFSTDDYTGKLLIDPKMIAFGLGVFSLFEPFVHLTQFQLSQ